jgi:hypothetical protein
MHRDPSQQHKQERCLLPEYDVMEASNSKTKEQKHALAKNITATGRPRKWPSPSLPPSLKTLKIEIECFLETLASTFESTWR